MFRLRLVAALSILSVALGGCSARPSNESSSENPYRKDIELAQEKVSSDFEREVFADLAISRAEYEEAMQRFKRCVESHGVSIGLVDQAGYYILQVGQPDKFETIENECRTGTIGLIEQIYVDKLQNPQKTDWNSLIAACLIRKGVAPAEYSGKDYADDYGSSFAEAPFKTDEQGFKDCHANPSA